MDGASILLVLAALGVSFGWQPDQDDPRAYEVTAQIEPELLEVLKSGREVPIEAHVPAEIAPIRKVRIVVGNAKLPRQMASTAAKPAERVVRGQEPSPRSHTANYEENDPWTSDRYPAGTTAPPPDSRQFDGRGATIGVNDIRTAQAPPSPWDRAQTAVNDSSNALRDGVESGIRQANDQYQKLSNQVSTSASNAGQAINQQYQNLTGGTARPQTGSWPAPPPSAATSAASSAITPAPSFGPPPTVGTAPTARAAAPSNPWTSIRPELAPPRLMNPPLAPLSTAGAGTRMAANPNGPTIPSLESPPLHSVLADPAANRNLPAPPANNSQPNWASGWGSNNGAPTQATIGSSANNTQSPWATNTATSPPPASNTQPPKGLWDDFPPQRQSNTTVANPAPADPRYATPSPANSQPAPAPQPPMIGTASTTPPATQVVSTTPGGEALPWIPLLVVSVSLAGSLGANLFLGWSYADARFRYRNLVRKTTNSFHRATSSAA